MVVGGKLLGVGDPGVETSSHIALDFHVGRYVDENPLGLVDPRIETGFGVGLDFHLCLLTSSGSRD